MLCQNYQTFVVVDVVVVLKNNISILEKFKNGILQLQCMIRSTTKKTVWSTKILMPFVSLSVNMLQNKNIIFQKMLIILR